MITLSDLRSKSERKYNDFLKWKVAEFFHVCHATPTDANSAIAENPENTAFFPLEIKSDKGNARDNILKRELELKPLIQKSKSKIGKGYSLIFEEVKTRTNGIQSKLSKILFDTEEDFLFFIEKQEETERALGALSVLSESHFEFISESQNQEKSSPFECALKNLSFLTVDHSDEPDFWKNIALCAVWLSKNRNSGLFIREIPLPVHTKFIENNKSLILSLVFPNETPSISQFESVFGLKKKPDSVRFRSLDSGIPFSIGNFSLSEISVPIEDFEKFGEAEIAKKIEKIFIIENEMVYLTFPAVKNAVCVWGHGFSVLLLKNSEWLKSRELFYFGDLDEHGFLILSDFRNHFESAKSFCMTKEILEKYEKFRVEGKSLGENQIPQNLTEDEKSVLKNLHQNPAKNRLEQERISVDDIKNVLEMI